MSSMRYRSRRCRLLALFAFVFFTATIVVTGSALGEVVVNISRGMDSSRLRTFGDMPARRRLIGPGSSPPTCRARCGRCSPCRPVHVAIQPGISAQWEYYPEVWRCKCGNKLFMP